MKKKKILIIVLSAVLALALVIGGTVAYLMSGIKPVSKERTIETEDGILRVGIVSDLRLPDWEGGDYEVYYKKALELFKEKGVNVIVNAGDFTDVATKKSYENHKRIFDSVYSEAEREKLELSYIMGNHDHWLPMFFDCWEIPFPHKMQSRFTDYTYAESPWTHKVINGYYFIAVSPSNGDMGDGAYDKMLNWAEEQIKSAVEADSQKPVFVITHNNPADTVYMSDGACKNLDELYSKYPQVVSISGHSHAPLMDEKAIYQKDYTAVNTQCTSYVCFDQKANSVVHNNSEFIEDNPMVMIMELDGSKAEIQRYSVLDGTAQKEPWKINAAAGKDGFIYTDARRDSSEVPVWDGEFVCTSKADAIGDDKTPVCRLEFTAANGAYGYRAVFKQDGKPVEFALGDKKYSDLDLISDFALNEEKRSGTGIFLLNEERFSPSLPAGTYTAEIYAYGAFGNESEPMTAEFEIAYK